ncbi:MAG: DUF1559 domain-containing protein [Planctomycetia bacterium]|nr:DUF1559 domain-containing protein [Planctomycetia bacterium]
MNIFYKSYSSFLNFLLITFLLTILISNTGCPQNTNGIHEWKPGHEMETSSSLRLKRDDINYTEFSYNESLGYRSEYNKATCIRHLGRISEALNRYAEAHDGYLPPVYSTDENGKPLHSWRVLILPYFLRQENLWYFYEKIRLNEPWDSEWNRQFHDQIPQDYLCLSQEYFSNVQQNIERVDTTCYTVITGDNTAFPLVGIDSQHGKGLPIKDIKDTNNTIFVIERNEPVCWMKPDGELTLEEITNGDFFNKITTTPRHTDKNHDFYICAAARYKVGLLNKYLTQEQLINMSNRNYLGKKVVRLTNRIVCFE